MRWVVLANEHMPHGIHFDAAPVHVIGGAVSDVRLQCRTCLCRSLPLMKIEF